MTRSGGGFINDSGQMAIPYYDGTVYKLSFIDRGVITPVTGIRVREFNNFGKMSGWCESQACVWDKATGYTAMGNVTLPNGSIGTPSEATGLSNQNQVAGTGWGVVNGENQPFAFTWSATTGTRFIDYGYGYAISDDSTVEYARRVPGNIFAGEHRLWKNGVVTHRPPITTYGINDKLELFSDNNLWNPTDGLKSFSFYINSLSDSTQVVGVNMTPRAMFWENGATYDLNSLIPANTGWVLKAAHDVNNTGQIVGWGTLNGQVSYFLLTPSNVRVCPVGCAYSSIQAALNVAAAGATIRVGAGTYREAIAVNGGQNLVSVSGAANTIIDATGKGRRAVTIGGIAGSKIDGFTITGGVGGIDVRSPSTIRNNRIANNTTTGVGGGIYSAAASLINNNVITKNRASDGGGIVYVSSSATITNNIEDNVTVNCGGGMTIPSNQTETINSNKLLRNSAQRGGGICIGANSNVVFSNMLIAGNFAQELGGGVFADSYSNPQFLNSTITNNISNYTAANGSGIFPASNAGLIVSNSIVWGNRGTDIYNTFGAQVTYSILGAATPGVGNVVANPLFSDTAAGNYRVKVGSPAIDTGRTTAASGVTVDLDGVLRPVDGDGRGKGTTGDGSDYDKGAFEFRR